MVRSLYKMKEKELLELTIESLGMEGEGVAHEGDRTFFVPYALPGEKVKVAVDRVKGRVVFAHIIKMLSPSAERREAGCPLFGKCGGCALRHLPYQKQLEVKKANVQALFRKNAGVDLADTTIIGGAEDGYRNKVALPFGAENGAPVLGMYKRGTHKVLPLLKCPLHGEWIEPMINATLCFAREKKLSVYDEKTGKGLLRHLVARRLPTPDGWEYGVIIVANGGKLPFEAELASRLRQALDGKVSVYLCKNVFRNNVILTDSIRTLCGEDHLRATICGGVAEVSPLAFLQVNFPIAERIYEAVRGAVPADKFVVDAYSGTGIMSALLGKTASEVVGIETIADAVRDANRNAALFGVENKVKHFCGEVETLLPDVVKDKKDYVLVVDPPRAGLDKTVIDTILKNPPERIVYVSCSPATLTRDIALLKDAFRLESVTLYDMFPQTPHVETVVILSRSDIDS